MIPKMISIMKMLRLDKKKAMNTLLMKIKELKYINISPQRYRHMLIGNLDMIYSILKSNKMANK